MRQFKIFKNFPELACCYTDKTDGNISIKYCAKTDALDNREKIIKPWNRKQ